ncbi:hypothetical protein P4O66_018614, partial [Electrophorus voltai]
MKVHEGCDVDFEQKFDLGGSDSLIITAIAWDCEWAAGVVQLSAKQKSLYSFSHAAPHVSLASAHVDPDWQRVGLWTKRVLSATDWIKEPQCKIMYSPSIEVWKTPAPYRLSCRRGVELVSPNIVIMAASVTLSEEEEEELKTVPAGLWAQGKNDVGLIKGCEPVHITPKSDYRPHQHQSPSKTRGSGGHQACVPIIKTSRSYRTMPRLTSTYSNFPVKKGQGEMNGDLCRICRLSTRQYTLDPPEFPKTPHPILSQIPPDTGEGSSSRGDEYATPHPPT